MFFVHNGSLEFSPSLLSKFAALRELYKAKNGNYSSEFSYGEVTRDIGVPQDEVEDIPNDIRKIKRVDEVERPASSHTSLKGLNDAADVFFDVPEATDYDQFDNEWPLEQTTEQHSLVLSGQQ